MRVFHTLEPVFNEKSKVLILGSIPSIKSRELNKYYGHKNNRFWQVMEHLFEDDTQDWKGFLLKYGIALWDVIESCDIEGSSDSSIKNVVVNDIKSLLDKTEINKIFLLGKSAYELYYKYVFDSIKIEGIYLPSPSSANATFSLNDLTREYKIIKDYCLK